MTDIASCYPWLEGKEQISLAELQLNMGCGYLKAKETLEKMRQLGYVSRTTQGLNSPVNLRYVFRRSLTADEVYSIGVDLSASQIMVLSIVHDALPKGGYRYTPAADDAGEVGKALAYLEDRGLVHSFEGAKFLSVDESSYKGLNQVDTEKANAPVIAMLAVPLLNAILEDSVNPEIANSFRMLPEVCVEYIQRHVEEYRRTGKKPAPFEVKLPDPEECKLRLALDMLQAFLYAYPNLETQASYMRMARVNVRKMRSYSFWDDIVIDAGDELLNMLGDMSMEDIQDLIDTRCDDDEDDED